MLGLGIMVNIPSFDREINLKNNDEDEEGKHIED